MANKTNKIIAAITKIRTMSKMKMVNHKCTTVRIQDPHLSEIINAARRRPATPAAATSTSTPSMPAPVSSGGGTSGGGGY